MPKVRQIQDTPFRVTVSTSSAARGDAPIFAAMQADMRAEAGNMEGHRVWLSIREAIEELQRTRPKRDEPTH